MSFVLPPGHWSFGRYHMFRGYCSHLETYSLLTGDEKEVNKHDLKNLLGVLHDVKETTLLRDAAGITLAYIHVASWSLQLKSFEKLLQPLIKKIYLDGSYHVPVKSVIRNVRTTVTNNLTSLLQKDNFGSVSMSRVSLEDAAPTFSLVEKVMVMAEGKLQDSDLNRRTMMIGGDKCDLCRKTPSESGVTNFNACSRCQRAYYCSPECQRAAWKSGHKKTCRKLDERNVGDIMHLRDLQERSELNGRLVELVAAVGEDHWSVRFYRLKCGGQPGAATSVGQNKLVHIRPAK